MNVGLPMANSPFAFLYVIALCLVISVLLILFFIKKRWL